MMIQTLNKLASVVGMPHVSIVLGDAGTGCGYADPDSQSIVIGRQDIAADYFGVCVHELAHVGDRPPLAVRPQPVAMPQAVAMLERIPNKLKSPLRRVAPWFLHGPVFIRLCLHLTHRAVAAGFDIGWPDVRFAGFNYGLSPAWRYARLLGNEPAELAHLTPWEIAALPLPRDLENLFRSDVSSYENQNDRHGNHRHRHQ